MAPKWTQAFTFSFFPGHGKRSPNPANPLSALEMTRLALFKMYNQAGLPGGPPHPPPLSAAATLGQAGLEMGRAMAEQHARALQAVREAEEKKEEEESEKREKDLREEDRRRGQRGSSDVNVECQDDEAEDEDLSPPPMKRERHFSGNDGKHNGQASIGGANIRIANRGKIYSNNFILNQFF